MAARDYGIRDMRTKRWLEGRSNAYSTGFITKPNYPTYTERPIAPIRNYVRYDFPFFEVFFR